MNVVTGITCSNCGASLPKRRRPCRKCGDTRRTFAAAINETVTATATISAATKRGPETWGYIYIVAGVLLAIMLAVVGVLDVPGWAKAVTMICLSIIILVGLLDSTTAHNLLLRLKSSYEDKWR
jgi:hypothetical protein